MSITDSITNDSLEELSDDYSEEIVAPELPTFSVSDQTDDYACFVAEPLKPGYGTTVGNALRRLLLSSLDGVAIGSVRIDQVQHEFSTIQGMREDTIEFLLNVKEVRLKPISSKLGTLSLNKKGAGEITAADLQVPPDYELVNPDLHLGTLDGKDAEISAEFHVRSGNGYLPATDVEGLPIGVIPVDCIFSPVRKCNFRIEKVRVGQSTNHERLVLEIWTDATIEPLKAISRASDIVIEQFLAIRSFTDPQAPEIDLEAELSPPVVEEPIEEKDDTPIETLELSVRTFNALRRSGINTVGQIVEHSKGELLSLRNFGEKSFVELREKLIAGGFADPSSEGIQAILPSSTASSGFSDQGDEDLSALGKALKAALREAGNDELLAADDEE